ncbi:short-subunit dehydrogenase [Rhizobium sp. PP-F2F-G48]|uniref:oxidoreductase n=1 Tax=Rhizobium sp. PP-F2F-G48 TaxID=2135651 RepID=UPI0010EFD009|nr:oxidoreductase [Rhizobium sp. PP-F2F-G48]TCM52303.1 short-subunit dehydrogenase [Rhizobium sp. PP-F2F-G48]
MIDRHGASLHLPIGTPLHMPNIRMSSSKPLDSMMTIVIFNDDEHHQTGSNALVAANPIDRQQEVCGVSSDQKTAFLTGASSGIGKMTAMTLTKAGYRVIGTSRKAAPGEVRDGIRLIACDVTSDASVAAAVAEAHAELGRIDLVINNAGFGIVGAAEESSLEQVRALYDTNVLGVVRVTNAVLPIMRAQGSGRILNVGSGLGFIPAPFNTHYSATKHALEGYSEALDHEVRGFGVRVLLVEPGATNTSFESSSVPADAPLKDYDRLRTGYTVAYDKSMKAADTAQSVADTILRAATDPKPKLRYPSGKVAQQGAFARRFLPRSLFDKVLHKQFGLG